MGNITQLKKGLTPQKAFNDLFGDVTYIKKIPISELIPYPKQNIFKKDTDTKMSELVADIKDNGMQQPIIVRPFQSDGYDYYQVVSGHRRWQACDILGYEFIEALINENLDDAAADKIFVGTNLNQRDELTYSEKAFCYKIYYEANKHQGKRNDLTNLWNSVPEVEEPEKANLWNSVPEVKESDRSIRNYIRLTELTDFLLSLVDEKTLPMKAGVALSYLSKDEQDVVYQYCLTNKINLSVVQAEDIKKFKVNFNELITEEILDRFLKPEAEPKKEKSIYISVPIKFTVKEFEEYFSEATKKEVSKEIYKIIQEYYGGI